MSKEQVKIIERRAVRRYKQELKSKVQAVMLSTVTFSTLIAGVIYNLI